MRQNAKGEKGTAAVKGTRIYVMRKGEAWREMCQGEYQKEYEIGDLEKKQMGKLGGGTVPEVWDGRAEGDGQGWWHEMKIYEVHEIGGWNVLERKLS